MESGVQLDFLCKICGIFMWNQRYYNIADLLSAEEINSVKFVHMPTYLG
jgi:hypothetical protein